MREASSDISIGKKEVAKDLINQILELGGSLMYWRLPNSDEKTLIICNSGASVRDEITLEGSMPGFAFAPFNPTKGKYFFHADLVFRFKNDEIVDGPDINNTAFFSKRVESAKEKKSQLFYSSQTKNEIITVFSALVEACIQKTESGQIEKIVPSKFTDIDLPENFDVVKTFDKLCEKHPNA
ncbi:MAG: hypothetical protein HY015_10335, partial [Bacteroidetes bacterium]|nr:hypothetical protein [Bacteroidota bacterium]